MKRKIIPAYFVLGWLLRLGCHSLKFSLIFRYLSIHIAWKLVACIKKCKLSRPHGGQTESLNFIHTCFDYAISVIFSFYKKPVYKKLSHQFTKLPIVKSFLNACFHS